MPWGPLPGGGFALFSKKGKGASSEEISFLFPEKVKVKVSVFSVYLSLLSCFLYYSAKSRGRERLHMKPVFPHEGHSFRGYSCSQNEFETFYNGLE